MTMNLKHLVRDCCARLLASVLERLALDPRYFELWQSHGFHVVPVHFYQPIPDTRLLSATQWQRQTALVGIQLNETKQLDLLSLFATRYREEYEKLPRDQISEKYHFFLNNVNFSSVDAELLFCMVRHFKPRRIVEIGSGSSTLLAADALARNHKEGFPGTMLAIEPFPRAFLRSDLPAQVELLPQVVQNIPLKEFEALHENDILFIDSSHVCKIGSDVQYEFLEILPRLAPGVLVHVHDIFLPVEYPESWLRKDLRFWNEQYLLQAFLCLNDCFEVLWAGHWLHLKHPDRLAKAFRSYGRDALPRSFWIRRVK